jgi:ABC-type glycerol-3-phosphate transport system substrate-binding protein
MKRLIRILLGLALLVPALASAQRTLEFWTFIDPAGDSPRSKALAEILRTFEQRHPGVKVKSTVYAWNQINLEVMKAARSGKVPDVSMLNSGRIQRQVAAGALTPLDPWLDKSGARADYILLPNAIGKDGKVYGVPYEVRALGFLYRSDLVKKTGLGQPKTLLEIAASARRMQEMQGTEFVGVGIGFDPNADSAEKFFIPAVTALGGKLLNADGSANFVIPQAVEVLNYLHDLVHKDRVLPLNVALGGPDPIRTLVEAGRTGYYFQGSHWLLTLRSKLPEGATLDFMPVTNLRKEGVQPVFVEGWNLGIPKGAKEAELGWKLIELWTSPEMQLMQSRMAGYLPMRKSAAKMVDASAPATAHIAPLLELISTRALEFPWPLNTDALQQSLGTAIINVLTNKRKPEQALAEAAANYNRMRE